MPDTFERYGALWPTDCDPLMVEFCCIQKGGQWKTRHGITCGLGLFEHYKRAQSLLWPEDDHHRWSDLILATILEERLTVIMGSRDSSKTRSVSKWALVDYMCFPNDTLVLMTSTNIRGLEMRVWGDIKDLHERAKQRFPDLPGNVVDAKHGIFSDDLGGDDDVRDMRRGIIGIPCIGSQGEFLGMALKDFAGIKQKRRRLVGDELQYIPVDYLKVLDSLDKGDFHGCFLGNPIADNGKALDTVSEPKEGWSSQVEVNKTTVWSNKYNGKTINLVGIDSPNFDKDKPKTYTYLLDQGDLDRVAARPGGRDSLEWWSQIMGVRKAGAVSNRVLTEEMIELNGGYGPCIWSTGPTLKIYAVDAGYGGDDCVRTYIECGEEVGGTQVILFGEQKVIPVLLSSKTSAEDQIALFAKSDCAALGVPDAHVFIEAGMRATLAVSFARIMSSAINAINFGGPATQRPVSSDLFVLDEKTQQRRPKTCYEHYSKFVTELAFSVRAVVECKQARNFPREAAKEFSKRIWEFVSGDRYELETKDDYKLRTGGKSPNFSDSTMIAVEGARRLGFVIQNIPDGPDKSINDDYLRLELQKYNQQQKKRSLTYK